MGDLGSNPQPKHAIPNCSQTVGPILPPGEDLVGLVTAIPPFAKLLWPCILMYINVKSITLSAKGGQH